MVWRTEGVQVVRPARWRQLDGLVGVYWEAESRSGARGYYLAEDPRIMIFFNDVSSRVSISNQDGNFSQNYRPMTRAIYIPAGVPMWTSSRSSHRFSHLNLHIHKHRMMRYLAPSVGSSDALAALRRPVEIQDIPAIETLAGLVVDEISTPMRHSVYAESLVGSIVSGLLDIPLNQEQPLVSQLSEAQMDRLAAHIDGQHGHRLTIAQMAAYIGLPQNGFAEIFKQTTGKTPLQWQLARRIDLAKNLLLENNFAVAEIAAQLGFTDQAHLTKAFRQAVGDTPAAWRRNLFKDHS